jgi:GTPase SAR1 family protein
MLTELNLSANRLTEFPDASSLQCMPSIKKLNLRSNSITSIPASSILVLKSTYIAELILCHNKIRSLPPEIGTLTSLTNFNLSNNLLVEMPTTILNLHNLLFSPTSFNVRRNQLISPPQEIAERSGLISIMQHFLGKSDPSKLYLGTSVRMVVVGNEDAGKSTLVTQLGKAQLSADGIADAEELTFWVPDSVTALHTHVPNQLTLTRPVRDALRDAYPTKSDSSYVDKDDTPLDIKENITINIHDFVGQEMYHAVSEMFFSESSLHIVAFDIVQTSTKHDCDVHVQYWVDLVQARAPGSSILVVATHGDLLSKDTLRDRLAMVQARLSTNEALRVADLKREIKGSVDTDHRAVLRKLAELRPVIHKPIAVFSAKDENSASLKLLIARISAIVTPTVSTPNPLRIVNVSLPQHYLDVKSMMNQLRTRFRHYCTIAELDEEVAVRNRAYTAPMKVPEESMLEITRNAVVYWASVGEVRR